MIDLRISTITRIQGLKYGEVGLRGFKGADLSQKLRIVALQPCTNAMGRATGASALGIEKISAYGVPTINRELENRARLFRSWGLANERPLCQDSSCRRKSFETSYLRDSTGFVAQIVAAFFVMFSLIIFNIAFASSEFFDCMKCESGR